MRKLLNATAACAVLLIGGLALTSCSGEPSDTSPTPDAADLEYFHNEAQALASSLGIEDPPDVEIERVIAITEWGPTQLRCLQEAGFPVNETVDGEGLDFTEVSDPSLADSLAIAKYTCEVKYPVDPKYMRPLTQDQLKELYTYRTGELLDCLASNGYPVSTKPPTEAVFVESDGAWSPYEFIAIADRDLKEITRKCPQADMSIYD